MLNRESTNYIGQSVPRRNARTLLKGQGQFVDDISLPGMLHVHYVRSPYSHANIVNIDKSDALQAPGVIAVITGKELLDYCKPWKAELKNLPPMKTTWQYAMPPERVCYQGEPVAAVVAESRALAEDAAELVDIEWEELPIVATTENALKEDGPYVHPEMGTNQAWRMEVGEISLDGVFSHADILVEQEFYVDRQTCVTLEPRGLIANYQSANGKLTLYHSSQGPHIKRSVYATQLGMKESNLRVICPDLGGSYGLKLHIFSDEIATAAISVMLNQPVKFIADRLESFLSDAHCRGHNAIARMALSRDGVIQALEVNDVSVAGAYLIHPRTSAIEPLLVALCTPLAYNIDRYRADVSLVYQHKVPTAMYRGVGMPVASLIMEGMMDAAARELGMDKAEIRQRNIRPDDAYPCTTVSGADLEGLSQQAAFKQLLEMSNYEGLRAEQKELRERGIYRGIAVVSVVEGTSPSPFHFGTGGAQISAREGTTLRLEADGSITCVTGLTEQGQGAYSVINQIVADTLNVDMDEVEIVMGDTAATPFGGGTWASRGTSTAGEATYQAATAMRAKLLDAAGTLHDVSPKQLTIENGNIVKQETNETLMTLKELGEFTHFKTSEFPDGFDPELIVTQHYSQRASRFLYTNCSMCVSLDVDVNTGAVQINKIWVVEDCGKVINPQLVDEQIRGGVVQGIGSSLYEQSIYDDEAQLRNGTLADYLVPMAGEMPDIEVAHLETPTGLTELGAKGCGEAGIIAVCGAIMNGINDALEPFSTSVTSQPFTPEKILKALGKI